MQEQKARNEIHSDTLLLQKAAVQIKKNKIKFMWPKGVCIDRCRHQKYRYGAWCSLCFEDI